MTYFVVMFYFALRYIGNIQMFTKELNALAQAEGYYAFVQNAEKEFLYSTEKEVLRSVPWAVAKDSIKQLYSLNQYLINYHIDNMDINSDEYKETFQEIYYGNLCSQSVVKLDLIPYPCSSFISNSAVFGLQTVMMRYFEQAKEVLKKNYIIYDNQGFISQDLLKDPLFEELYIIQFRFLHDCFRTLLETFTGSVNSGFQSTIDTRMAAFIVFIIALILAYLILWTPFVNKLNKEIWRTKSMLTIIPIEVILKIPRIQEFLHSQSFFSNKNQSSQ